MKRYLLSYSPMTKVYNLDYGCFDRQRISFRNINDGQELIKKLDELIKEKQRKTVIYTDIDIDDPIKKLLIYSFKGTCIKFDFKKDLESLC